MSWYFRYIIILLILLVTSIAIADSRIIGHMPPLLGEKLNNPVELNCGAVIQEAKGELDYAKINSMCTYAYVNFPRFIKAKNLSVDFFINFHWNLSFLPEGSCYRCLNDEEYRFHYRYVHGHLVGYTDRDIKYSFMSSTIDGEFNTTFVHELFHSMSMFYGVYDKHPGNWSEKTAADERLAEEFTEWLGYGK